MVIQAILNQDAEPLTQILDRYLETKGYPWFNYHISRTASNLEPVIKAVKTAQRPSIEEEEVEVARAEMLKKHAVKDANGNPVTTITNLPDGKQFVRYELTDDAAFQAEFRELLSTKYPDLDEQTKKRSAEYLTLLATTTEIEVYPFKYSEAPPNLITGRDMQLLLKYNIMEWDLESPEMEDSSPSTEAPKKSR